MVINVGHFSSTQSLHEGLAAALGFPGWYGNNWDAFRDCISHSDISEMPPSLTIRGYEVLAQRLPHDAKLLRECLGELNCKRPDITVMWEVLDDPKS